jgi:hypothetical protein
MGDEKEDSPQPEVKDEPKADEAKTAADETTDQTAADEAKAEDEKAP